MNRYSILMAAGIAAFFSWTVSAADQHVMGNAAESIMVDAPYVRAVPPGQPNSAAFMTLMNHGEAEHAVVAAESPVANVVELHTHIHEKGMMKMRRIDKISILGKSNTVLKPGGLHIMLIGLKQELVPGEKVTLSLTFEDGSRKEVVAPVNKVMAPGNMNGAMMKHDMK